MRQFILPALFTVLAGSTAFAAPVLRAEVSVNHPVVTVGDMFEDAGLLAERALFRAPAPGTTGMVSLEAIRAAALKAGLTDYTQDGLLNVRVERRATVVDVATLTSLISGDLAVRGLLPAGAELHARFDNPALSYNAEAVDTPVTLVALRYQAGETNQLESATSAAQAMEVKNQIQQNNADIGSATSELQTLLNTQQAVTAAEDGLVKKTLKLALADSSTLAKNPMLRYLGQQIALNQQQLTVERQKKLPDLLLGYTNQSFRGVNLASGAQEVFSLSDRFHVLHAGISIPLLPGGYKSSVNAARISGQIAAAQLEYEKINLSGELNALIQEFGKNRAALDYYEQTALPQAALITTQARQGFSSGETSYTQLLQSISVAIKIRTDYLDKLYLYNLTVHQIEALLGIQ